MAVICAGLALAIVVGAKERSSRPLSAGATRYVTLQSNRYAYWRVAMRAFGDEPIRGVGAGGWAVYWLRYRTINEFAQDAHSLPLQTLAELGIIGVVFLLMFVGGVGLAARDALKPTPALCRWAGCGVRGLAGTPAARLGLADAGRDAHRDDSGRPGDRALSTRQSLGDPRCLAA